MGGNWIEVYHESAGLMEYIVEIEPYTNIARLRTNEYSIGGDDEPWLESEETVTVDEALKFVYPDEAAIVMILENCSGDYHETLKELGYKAPDPVKTCPKCGTQVKEDYLFCHRCGADLQILICLPKGTSEGCAVLSLVRQSAEIKYNHIPNREKNCCQAASDMLPMGFSCWEHILLRKQSYSVRSCKIR